MPMISSLPSPISSSTNWATEQMNWGITVRKKSHAFAPWALSHVPAVHLGKTSVRPWPLWHISLCT